MSSQEVRLVLEEMTPERALDLIVGNTDNRNIRQTTVEAYARDMRAGRWRNGQGEPIHVDLKTKQIGNGQHRLLAIIESEATCLMPMLYAPIEWRMYADQGMKRTFADVLRITHHEAAPNQLAAAIRYLWEYRRSGVIGISNNTVISAEGEETVRIGKPTVAELEQVYLADKGLRDHLVQIGRMREAGLRIFPSLMVALDYLFHEVDYDDAEEFAHGLIKGDMLPDASPILALRRVMSGDSRPNRARVQAALVIKTWNAWRAGEEMKLLAWKAGGSSPEAFPKIDGMPPVPKYVPNPRRRRRARA